VRGIAATSLEKIKWREAPNAKGWNVGIYRNDWTAFKVLQSELRANIILEDLCREIRSFFS